MTPRALQIVQRILITATSLVLALVVLTAFVRVLRPASPEVLAAAVTTTTVAPPGEGTPTGTLEPDPETEEEPDSTTTTVVTESITCDPPPAPDGGTVLRVYYTCGTPAQPTPDAFVRRAVPTTDLVLTGTLQQMVAGPTAEEREAGYTSYFSNATADSFAGVSLDARVATVDFSGLDVIEGIDSEPGSDFFLAELNANVFQFGTIDSVEYRLDGSCEDFFALLGQPCTAITAGQWTQAADGYRAESGG